MNRLEIFKDELDLIKNKKIKDLVEKCLLDAPEYFFKIPASSTGKYHPVYSLGEGGLVRHTKAAVKLAEDLLSLEMYTKLIDKHDEIIAALILHDSIKKGLKESLYTNATHPLDASKFVKDTSFKYKITEDFVDEITVLIETHMGQWNKDPRTKKEILAKPVSVTQKFVHMCDYLASRKYLTVEL